MGYVYNPLLGLGLDNTGAGGGGTPGGSTTQVQFNDAGAFGGDADLTWNKTTNVLGITGDVNLSDGGTYTTTLQTITPTAARTISFPDATGTVALVGGSSGQLLYNNAGANAGASTLTYDGSILTSSGRFINSYNATASAPAKAFTGTWFTGGTATTTKPQVLVEPTGATSTAWSTSGTGLGVNAASGFAGRLLDLQINGTSRCSLTAAGVFTVVGSSGGETFTISANGAVTTGRGIVIPATQSFTFLGRSLINSAADGQVTLFNNNADNFSRLNFGGTTSSFPALNRNSAVLETKLADNSAYAQHAASVFQAATAHTVATLPGAPAVGMIARVTDATAPAVGVTVVGGGAAAALCWYNGANWSVIGV